MPPGFGVGGGRMGTGFPANFGGGGSLMMNGQLDGAKASSVAGSCPSTPISKLSPSSKLIFNLIF